MHGFSATRRLAVVALAATACQARAPEDGRGRHLDPEQVAALRAACAAVPRDVQTELRAVGGDAEAVSFMHELRRPCVDGRGEAKAVIETSASGYPSRAGVLVCVQEKPGSATDAARVLHGAMSRIAIPTLDPRICLVDSRRWGGGETIVLFVGVRDERAR
jgi:hypothetical protein